MNLLSVDNLSIEYVTPRGVVRAVDGISFEVPRSASCVLCLGELGQRPHHIRRPRRP